jgi:hypothetical protein
VRGIATEIGLSIVLVLIWASPLWAFDSYWQLAGTGNWLDSLNWTLGIPSQNDNAIVANGGMAVIGSEANIYLNTLDIGYDPNGNNGGYQGTVQLSGGQVTAESILFCAGTNNGTANIGTFIHTAGQVTVNNIFYGQEGVSQSPYNRASYQLYDGTLKVLGNEQRLGGCFTSFIQYNGLHSIGNDLEVGSYTLRGGELTIGNHGSYGTFNQTGGIHRTNNLYFERYNLSGGNVSVNNDVYIYNSISPFEARYFDLSFVPLFNQTNGSHVIAGNLMIGLSSGIDYTGQAVKVDDALGFYHLDGADSVLTVQGSECISGYFQSDENTTPPPVPVPSHFEQKNGTHQIAQNFYLGTDPNGFKSYGTYLLSGGTLNIGSDAYLTWDWATLQPPSWIMPYQTINPIFIQSGSSNLNVGGSLICEHRLDLQGGIQTIAQDLQIGELHEDSLSTSTGGILNMSGGTLHVGRNEYLVGYSRTNPQLGIFTQTNGIHEIDGNLYIGRLKADVSSQNGTQGLYKLSGAASSLMVRGNEYIVGRPQLFSMYPVDSISTFVQTNGSHFVQHDLYVGYDPEQANANGGAQGYGLYRLSQGTLTIGGNLYLGKNCQGSTSYGGSSFQPAIRQEEGSELSVGGNVFSQGTIQINGGSFQVDGGVETIGWSQTGGVARIGQGFTHKGALQITQGELDVAGDYENFETKFPMGSPTLSGGGILTIGGNEYIGGVFVQSGGTHTVQNDLVLRRGAVSGGQYQLQGGYINVNGNMILGAGAEPIISREYFGQLAGVLTVQQNIYIDGTGINGSGPWYSQWHGQLIAQSLNIGQIANGNMLIGGDVYIMDSVNVGNKGSLSGSGTIHLSGPQFAFGTVFDPQYPEQADSQKNLKVLLEGGPDTLTLLEVAGLDRGAVLEGFSQNFSLGTLTLGGTAIGRVRLVDAFDNRLDGIINEALYVQTLNLDNGAYLDLNGYNLYYQTAWIDSTARIDFNGGQLIQIPEPISFLLFALTGLAFIGRSLR